MALTWRAVAQEYLLPSFSGQSTIHRVQSLRFGQLFAADVSGGTLVKLVTEGGASITFVPSFGNTVTWVAEPQTTATATSLEEQAAPVLAHGGSATASAMVKEHVKRRRAARKATKGKKA